MKSKTETRKVLVEKDEKYYWGKIVPLGNDLCMFRKCTIKDIENICREEYLIDSIKNDLKANINDFLLQMDSRFINNADYIGTIVNKVNIKLLEANVFSKEHEDLYFTGSISMFVSDSMEIRYRGFL